VLRFASMRRVRSEPRRPGELTSAPRAAATRGLEQLDVFLLVNAAVFAVLCAITYHDKWVSYMGTGRTAEFLLYGAAILGTTVALRASLPRRPVPPALLVLLEVFVLSAFAGECVRIGQVRLYDRYFLGLRFDQYVHAWGALVVGICILEMLRMRGLPAPRFVRVLACFATLGCLALWELFEAVIRSRIPGNGIGGYEDTVGDLWANLAGALVFLAVGHRLHAAMRRPHDEHPETTP